MSRSVTPPPIACVMGDMDLVRPLGLAGIRCAVVAHPDELSRYSRFTHVTIPWAQEDISDGADDLLRRLLDFAAGCRTPPVLFYEQDSQLLFISRNRDRLATAFRFVIGGPDLVEDLVDKGRFQELAERLDLPVPPTQRVRPGSGVSPDDVDIPFPVVVKPLWRRRSWEALGGAAKVVQIDDRGALRAAWPRWVGLGMDLLIQQMIPGPESCIESYHVYVDAGGGVAGAFTGRKIRTLPTTHGYSTALTITDARDVAELGRSLVKTIGLTGVAKFDFKRDPQGRLHLLEINPRFNLWHHLGAVAGVNLPALAFADLTGGPRPAQQPLRVGVCWCRFSEDWRAAKASGVSFRTWLPWALGCEATSLAWDDPMPFVYRCWRSLSGQLGAGPSVLRWRDGGRNTSGVT